jgi:predicted RNase H-like HicB family nuclease
VTEGDDAAQALAMTREAVRLYLRYAGERGLPVPAEPARFRLATVEVDVAAEAAAAG